MWGIRRATATVPKVLGYFGQFLLRNGAIGCRAPKSRHDPAESCGHQGGLRNDGDDYHQVSGAANKPYWPQWL